MILSEMLGSEVVDSAGQHLGALVDVRLEISGAPHQLLAETVVVGILVSPHSRTSTWGFERRGANAPAIIARPQHWLHRGMFLIAWADVAQIDEGRVRLRDGYERLDPVLASTAHPH
ncbi:PRC-barrel domain containing protein [Agromyces sp. ISL-38]|uniref:PRC-barrel domain containing protein n=1 Tax=Agromyces sp. ISL-38 TaxID=2819107 RepID=UPI001BE6C11A|nr:PRC-barrel domain containing protein [Agromyces sp. ISL-38]MBT2500671.1 PRC-barrel domain containing protein [Agromyces sp. ISL-38]